MPDRHHPRLPRVSALLGLIAAGSLSFASLPLHAQETPAKKQGGARPANPDYAAAKRHYGNAEKAAAEENWELAAMEYSIAYDITQDPVLFFKLGNAFALSGKCAKASEYFTKYIDQANPAEEFRQEARERVEGCKASETKGATSTTTSEGTSSTSSTSTDQGADSKGVDEPVAPSNDEVGQSTMTPFLSSDDDDAPSTVDLSARGPNFLEEESSWEETAAWVSVGLSAALLSSSAILALSANSREEDIDNLLDYRDADGRPAEFDATVEERYQTLSEEGEDLERLSRYALGAAGITVSAAVVFFLLDDGDKESSLTAIVPVVDSNGVGVGAGWSF